MSEFSPFAALGRRDVEQILDSSPELGIALHRFERDRSTRFCSQHRHADSASQSTWRLHAALVHLMLQPLVESYKRACAVASTALCSSTPSELELAFRGDARDSFVWLQCLMSEEREWCTTIGCPACCTIYVLSSESTIRTVITAALLSGANDSLPEAPDFTPILSALEIAMANDSFWSPMHYPHLFAPSQIIADGLRDLRQQCCELAILVNSPTGSASSDDSQQLGYYGAGNPQAPLLLRHPPATLIPVRPGRMARRQIELEAEQMEHMTELFRQCASIDDASDSKQSRKSGTRKKFRTRS